MNWWTWRDMHGAVIERVEGRLLDISASGCRLESASTLEVGSVGVIEIRDLATPIAEAARVCHTIERPGAFARYVLQLEFLPLPLERRAPASVAVCNSDRIAVDQLLPGSGERSDSDLTNGALRKGATAAGAVIDPAEALKTQQSAAITETAEALADTLNYGRPVTRGRMGHDSRCQREPSAFSGTTWIRAED